MAKVISVSVSLAVGDDDTTDVQHIASFTRTSTNERAGLEAFDSCAKAIQTIEALDLSSHAFRASWEYFRGEKLK